MKGVECPNCRSYLIHYHDKLGFECGNCGTRYVGVDEVYKITKMDRKLIHKLSKTKESKAFSDE